MALSLRLWLLRRLTRTTTTTATMAPLLIVLVLLCCLTTTSTTSTEAYFNGTTTATGRLTSASTSAYHVGFSFRSCDPIQGGTLLNQVTGSGDRLKLELLPAERGGRLRLAVTIGSVVFSTEAGFDLADNRWHDVDLRFHDRRFQLRLDGQWSAVTNDSSSSSTNSNSIGLESTSSLFRLSSSSSSSSASFSLILGGDGFNGCLIDGPSIRLADDTNGLVRIGSCPIPLTGNCSGNGATDPCWSQPCFNNGKCEESTTPEGGFDCQCPLRFEGDRCQIDSGALCLRPEFSCLNGGSCREDANGNGTRCICPTGFIGPLCETTAITCSPTDANRCLNNATCHQSSSTGDYECLCRPGWTGRHCDEDVDECLVSPCLNGGICIDGVDNFTCECDGTGHEGDFCQTKIDHCRSEPCQHGATCFDRFTGYVCQCSPQFAGINCERETIARMVEGESESCESEPCLNGGICSGIDGGSIECLCADGFIGRRCEILADTPNPRLGQLRDASACGNVTTCPANSVCESSTCVCLSGFTGSPPDCVNVDDCASSPCQNNATCTDLVNGYDCLCPEGFNGPQCATDVDNCLLSPCLNGATCTDGLNSRTCLCAEGFEGVDCSVDIDECSASPCGSHSTNCVNLVADYRCVCEPGWTGRHCDVDIDECASAPCMNNATCTDQLNGYVCLCHDGFTGDRCQVNIDDCALSPCLNNGTCVDGANNYTCNCPPEFMGRHCDQEFDACASSPCQNGASCITTKPQHNFYCECLPGFEGMYCENNIDECFSVQCADGKQCFDLINRYECRCPLGFSGLLCRDNIDDCQPSPCVNGGSCIDGIANYTCSCAPGFTGRNCSEDVDECAVLRPCVYGICQNTIGSYQCYCRPGFSGDNCNLEFDECLSHPCRNNGTCTNLINGYECVCAPGFTGKDCDININECESSPCQNNGTCIDGVAAFSCVCRPGFTGSRCEINIDECQSAPCLNEGLCVDGIDSYQCDCSDTGFSGQHCENNVDDCESAPCVHDSRCVDLVKDYQCACHPGYEGKNCEQDVNECLNDSIDGTASNGPCQNGAQCYERSNRTLYDDGIFAGQVFSYNTSGGYLCRCLPGYEGTDCQIDIDECALATPRHRQQTTGANATMGPCKFGTCVDGVNSFTCRCLPGYEGSECELEIDECQRHSPCRNGATCRDRIADYDCLCPANYGGKNCSVELLGCIDVSCLHGGTCVPHLVEGESPPQHGFTCQCPFGYHGQLCQHATTMSFNGSSYMPVQTSRDEGYDLSFRFRTTLPSGLLAVGQGQTYYRLELLDGQLNLHSSLLNKWEGVFLGAKLNDAEWQSVRVRFNFTHLHLVVNQQEATYPINPVESINSTETSFGMTVLGGATSFLRILAQGLPFFVGCMENVVVNNQWVIPSQQQQQQQQLDSNILQLAGFGVEMGCPRTDHCRPNPCSNGGTCNDLWTFFNCSCPRPHLGDTCQLSYTPATFGHENSTDTHVAVSITPQERLALSNAMDISMFVRTRESVGLIFYIGTPPGESPPVTSYVAAQLRDGRLVVVVDLGDGEQLFPVINTPRLDDGSSHLVNVIRDRLQLRVKINGTVQLDDQLTSFRPLQAQILYLGGLPPSARNRRQTTSSSPSLATSLEGRNFKGIIQDIQIKSGNITRIVEIFPLTDVPATELLPEPLGEVRRSGDVLQGVVSDDNCRSDPCVNGGNCTITWNDFACICPTGFKGKTCSELEFCAIHQCPTDGVCQNLNDGYECVTSATFNGANTTLRYVSSGISANDELEPSINFRFRSRRGGTVLVIQDERSNKFLRIDVDSSGVLSRWMGNETLLPMANALDGDWHSVELNLSSIFPSFAQLVVDGQILLGGGSLTEFSVHSMTDEESTESPSTASSSSVTTSAVHFRGCLDQVRLGGLLLPFFPASELTADPSARKFRPIQDSSSEQLIELECRLCFDSECRNGAKCLDSRANYTCDCLAGYEGDLCQTDIDECLGNACVNGKCMDGVANYTCRCDPGWTNWLCDEDIDECAPEPCQNNGTCSNLIGNYECNCTEDFVGVDCERPRVVTCANAPCLNGANCTDSIPILDVESSSLQTADNYTCHCPFGYEGVNCELPIDYCLLLDPCRNGAFCTRVFFEPGYICECAEGFSGDHCEVDINECAQKPCLNGGRCIDGINNFTCDCSNTGYEGYLCEVDVDECRRLEPCVRGRCVNSPGSYSCICESEDDCGRHCDQKDPCKTPLTPFTNETVCYNGATCTAFCDDLDALTNQPRYTCACLEGFEGRNCSLTSPSRLEPNLKLVAIIVPIVAALLLIALVGSVVFVMMARNKRATRGTYSPSRQEMFSPRVEMGQVMKPPPEERLI